MAFLDSDDEFLPNKLERCLTQLEGETNVAVYSQTFVDRGVYRMWVKPARGLLEGRTYSTIFYCTSSGCTRAP